jgi:hypothetical protein
MGNIPGEERVNEMFHKLRERKQYRLTFEVVMVMGVCGYLSTADQGSPIRLRDAPRFHHHQMRDFGVRPWMQINQHHMEEMHQ